MANDVNAASSPAPVTPQQALDRMSSEQRRSWQFTGKVPEEVLKPQMTEKPAESSTAPAPEEEHPEATKATSAPDSGTGKQEPHKKGGKSQSAEERVKQLLAQNKRLESELAEARKPPTQAASSPAAKTEAPVELKKPIRPKLDEFKDKPWVEYDAAVEKYTEDMAQFEARKAVQEYQQNQRDAEQRRYMNVQVEEAKKAYPNFDTVVLPAMNAIFGDGKPESGAHPAIREALGRSSVMSHLLYTLGGNKELSKFVDDSRKDPVSALMKLGAMEALLIPELSKAGKEVSEATRNGKGQFTAPAPEKKTTTAPPPPTEVGGQATAPADPVMAAVKRKDFRAYEAEANARERAARLKR